MPRTKAERGPPDPLMNADQEVRAPKPLEVRELSTTLFTRRGEMKAVDRLSLQVAAGETVALVGESGCGKSLSALSIMRLLPDPPARIVGGAVVLNGRDIVPVPEQTMLDIRGKEIGDRKSTRLNSSHSGESRMPSSA